MFKTRILWTFIFLDEFSLTIMKVGSDRILILRTTLAVLSIMKDVIWSLQEPKMRGFQCAAKG